MCAVLKVFKALIVTLSLVSCGVTAQTLYQVQISFLLDFEVHFRTCSQIVFCDRQFLLVVISCTFLHRENGWRPRCQLLFPDKRWWVQIHTRRHPAHHRIPKSHNAWRTVREHSTKRTDGIIHRPCTRTTTHRPAQHELALCDRCHTAWASGAHGWVPAGHPRYTRADFGQEAVGGSTTTTRTQATRDARHAVRTPSVLFTRTWGWNKGGEHRDGWQPNSLVAEQAHPQHGSVRVTTTWQWSYVAD